MLSSEGVKKNTRKVGKSDGFKKYEEEDKIRLYKVSNGRGDWCVFPSIRRRSISICKNHIIVVLKRENYFEKAKDMFSTLKKKYFSRKRSIAAVADDADGNLSDFDSSSLGNGEDDEVGEDHDLEGPTLIAVDDGKGGFKHVRVSRPPDAQSEKSAAPGVSNTQETQPKEPPNIATLLTKELMGKHILHLESDVEKLKKRIVSKRGVVHVGRTHLERKQRRKYLADIFSTMLDMQWRYVLLVFTLRLVPTCLRTYSTIQQCIFWYRQGARYIATPGSHLWIPGIGMEMSRRTLYMQWVSVLEEHWQKVVVTKLFGT